MPTTVPIRVSHHLAVATDQTNARPHPVDRIRVGASDRERVDLALRDVEDSRARLRAHNHGDARPTRSHRPRPPPRGRTTRLDRDQHSWIRDARSEARTRARGGGRARHRADRARQDPSAPASPEGRTQGGKKRRMKSERNLTQRPRRRRPTTRGRCRRHATRADHQIDPNPDQRQTRVEQGRRDGPSAPPRTLRGSGSGQTRGTKCGDQSDGTAGPHRGCAAAPGHWANREEEALNRT